MEKRNKNRFQSVNMAQSYDKMCRLLVPGYEFMQDTLIDILKFNDVKDVVLLDLGAGSGILIEKVLKEFPDSKCYYLDSSNEFMSIAVNKLKDYKDRITYINSDLCGDWETKIDEKPNVITSMSAIHHLSNNHKKKLYSKCYNILEENGWFFNIDEMKTINVDAYMKSLHYWVYHVENQTNRISDDLTDAYRGFVNKFNGWRKRNVDNIDLPKEEGDDIHESFLTQLDCLEEIGFEEVDVFVKILLWCMIGGQKKNI